MNISFFGSSLVSAYWNGACTYYRGLLKELARLGHRVTFYEPDAYDRQKHRDIEDPDWAKVVVYDAATDRDIHKIVHSAQGADLIVKASGVGVFDAELEAAVLELQNTNTRIAFWDGAAPAPLHRIEKNPNDPFRQLIPQYDLILPYGGGNPVVEAYERFNARRCVPIYNALDPETHHPVPADHRFECDLAFLGNRLPDREARVEEFFLNVAARVPNKNFILGGNGWSDKWMSPNVKCIGHVYTRDHNALNCTPRAVLNISRESMARYGFSPATRVFEAAGAAACIITDYWIGIEMFLEPDREVLVAKSGAEVERILQSLTPAAARAIGRAA